LHPFNLEFRNLVFYSIEKIEIYLRTQVSYTISQDFGSSGYLDSINHHNKANFNSLLSHIQKEVSRSKEIFAKHFFDNYLESNLPV